MEANELRIGNIVYEKVDNYEADKNGHYHVTSFSFKEVVVDGIFSDCINPTDFNSMGYSGIMFDRISGIPLTEERLLKFGFKHKSITMQNKVDVVSWLHLDIEGDYGASIQSNEPGICCLRDCDDGMIGKSFEYVHQLQNLYFALTGKELEINKSTDKCPKCGLYFNGAFDGVPVCVDCPKRKKPL